MILDALTGDLSHFVLNFMPSISRHMSSCHKKQASCVEDADGRFPSPLSSGVRLKGGTLGFPTRQVQTSAFAVKTPVFGLLLISNISL
jgi:hypothetical protein